MYCCSYLDNVSNDKPKEFLSHVYIEYHHTTFNKLENTTKLNKKINKNIHHIFNIQPPRNIPKFSSNVDQCYQGSNPTIPRNYFQKFDSFLLELDHTALTEPCLDIT